jgi:hypothetical protein
LKEYLIYYTFIVYLFHNLTVDVYNFIQLLNRLTIINILVKLLLFYYEQQYFVTLGGTSMMVATSAAATIQQQQEASSSTYYHNPVSSSDDGTVLVVTSGAGSSYNGDVHPLSTSAMMSGDGGKSSMSPRSDNKNRSL